MEEQVKFEYVGVQDGIYEVVEDIEYVICEDEVDLQQHEQLEGKPFLLS